MITGNNDIHNTDCAFTLARKVSPRANGYHSKRLTFVASIVLLILAEARFSVSVSYLVFQQIHCADAFSLTAHRQRQVIGRNFLLHAKNSGKSAKKNVSTRSGSGFGSFTSQKKSSEMNKADKIYKEDNDYAIFPRLEPLVLDTLRPAYHDSAVLPSGLSSEISQRIDQIYGFSNFNYKPAKLSTPYDESTAVPSAFIDIISTVSPSRSFLTNDNLYSTQSTSLRTNDVSSAPSLSESLDLLPLFDKIRILHVDPLVLAIDDFFTASECDRYISLSKTSAVFSGKSPTVGKDKKSRAQRTSTTWYHPYQNVPELLAKANRLLGLVATDSLAQWEEPQTVRYQRNEQFTWHLDALGPSEAQARPERGGQRIATLLVYLQDLQEKEGGATVFRDLYVTSSSADKVPVRVQMRPQKGSALLFFPAAGGIANTPLDIRTLHCGQVIAGDSQHDKWISQLWLRQHPYTPSLPMQQLQQQQEEEQQSASSPAFTPRHLAAKQSTLSMMEPPTALYPQTTIAVLEAISKYCQQYKMAS